MLPVSEWASDERDESVVRRWQRGDLATASVVIHRYERLASCLGRGTSPRMLITVLVLFLVPLVDLKVGFLLDFTGEEVAASFIDEAQLNVHHVRFPDHRLPLLPDSRR